MSKYSEFVKAHMAKHKMTWSCAVCEIKKDNLYKKGKAPEKKAPAKKKGYIGMNREPVEDDVIPPGIRSGTGFSDGLPNNDYGVKQYKKEISFGHTTSMEHTSVDKKVLPAPPVRMPSLGTLGSLPIELGSMIQDFIRPTEQMLKDIADAKEKEKRDKLNKQKKKLKADIEYYAEREAEKYREFQGIYRGFKDVDREDREQAPEEYAETLAEFKRYDGIFKEHFEDMEEFLNVEVPKYGDMFKPTYFQTERYRFHGRDDSKEAKKKDFRIWMSKMIKKAQQIKRSIKEIDEMTVEKVRLLLN